MRNRRLIRILAIVLVALLVGGVVVSALLSALAEPGPAASQNRIELTMDYLEDEQALRVEQRLVYVNGTGGRLDRVVFHAAANMLRRESALMYEPQDLEAVFPAGYAPGGIDLRAVRVDGVAADYGFQGEDELYLRVACDIAPGGSAAFEFEYYLLLTECRAFIGVGETDVRLSAFCLTPCVYDGEGRRFSRERPLPFTRWLDTPAADYQLTLTLPEGCLAAASGNLRRVSAADGRALWRGEARGARDMALCFGRRYRAVEVQTEDGATVRVLSRRRDGRRVARLAADALSRCAAWFGPSPVDTLTVAESDDPLEPINAAGLILMPSGLFDGSREATLKAKLRFCVAQQYFGLSAWVTPSADAWLSDSVSAYVASLLLEDADGHDAFLKAINRDWVSALQLTIPGGLRVTSDAALFNAYEYDIVVKTRGAVVLHELREAMGLEALLQGLAKFYALGRDGRTLTEMDFVACMDAASGRSWKDFLTDWVFNVGEYVNQPIDWFS